jgi:hypothetical protein
MRVTTDRPAAAEGRDGVRASASQQVDAAANAKRINFESWFSRAMWLGILANCLLAIPGIFWPNAALQLLGQTPDLEHPVWPAFASLLLVLLSLFYIPGALDLRRYKATAILSVLARLAGVVFFLRLWPGLYPAFGYLDLLFLLIQVPLLDLVLLMIQAPLLYLALRQQAKNFL